MVIFHGYVSLPEGIPLIWYILTGAKRREWMGMDGLLGLLLIVMTGIIPENSLRSAPVSIM